MCFATPMTLRKRESRCIATLSTAIITKKQLSSLHKPASEKIIVNGGPDVFRNSDDASEARIEVHRYAQHRNNNKRTTKLLT